MLELVGTDFGVFDSVLSASVTFGAVAANFSTWRASSCTRNVACKRGGFFMQACSAEASRSQQPPLWPHP